MTAHRRLATLLVLSLVAVLAACGSGDEPSLEAGSIRDDGAQRQLHPTPEAAASAVRAVNPVGR